MDKYLVINEKEFTRIPISPDGSEINLNDVTAITGLYDLEIMLSDWFDLRFFLMSDLHNNIEEGFKEPGLYLPIYLDALFKQNKDKQFDLLLEMPPLKKAPNFNKMNSGVFTSMYRQFKGCYASNDGGKLCSEEWPNVRFHNIDIRQISHDTEVNNFDFPLLNTTLQIYNSIKHMCFGKLEDDQYKTKFYELLMSIIDLSEKKKSKSIGEYFISEIYKSEKYSRYKTLEHFADINASIINHMNAYTIGYDIFETCILLHKKGNNVDICEMQSFVINSLDLFRNLRSAMADLYSLLRILKIKSYGGKNIFVLAGNNHIRTIKSVIGSIDFYSVNFIKGSEEIEDWLYKNFVHLIIRKIIKIPIDTSKIIIRVELVLDILMRCVSNDINEDDATIIKKLRVALYNIVKTNERKIERIAGKHPGEKFVRIEYSLIKDNLY